MRILAPIASLLLFCASAATQDPAPPAQDPAPPAREPQSGVSADTLRDLVATIQDPAKRRELVDQLQALIQAGGAAEPEAEDRTDSVLGQLSGFFTSLSDEISQMAVALIDQVGLIPARVSAFAERWQDPGQRRVIVADLTTLGAVLLVGLGAAILVWYLTRRPRRRLEGEGPVRPDRLGRAVRALVALVLDLLPVAILVAVTFGGLALFPATRSGTALMLALMAAIAVKWGASALLGSLLAPDAPRIRPLRISDELAIDLTRSLGRLLSLGIYGFFALEAVVAIGADAALLDPLRSLYGLLLLACGIFVVLKYRRAGRGERVQVDRPEAEPATARWSDTFERVLGLWWVVAIVYLVGLYTVWMSRVEGGFAFVLRASGLTAAVLVVAALVTLLLQWVLHLLGRYTKAALGRLPVLAQRVPRYVSALSTVAKLAVQVVALGFVLDAWGVGAIEILTSPAALVLIRAVLNILLVILIAAAAVDVATAFTQAYLTRSEKHGRASAKVKTLVPLAHKTIKFFVVVIASMTVLSQFGMDIGPILAGVGVLGLAIGFGAQTLVKDIITGAFILIEDSVSVGDIVTLSGTGGLVEAINIRTIRLRDLSGNVHTIPFSTVGTVTNMTKDFSRYLIEAGVAYREDVDEVIDVLKELGEEMRKDPEWGPDMLEPIEILGLDRFEDSAVIVRARLITKPARQWSIGREFNRRLKRAFDERNIEIPFPHRTLYMGQDKDGKAPPLPITKDAPPARGADSEDPAPHSA